MTKLQSVSENCATLFVPETRSLVTRRSAMPNLVLGQTLPNVLQYHAQPSALNIILAEGLVFHLLPEVFHLRQQPFLPLQQHQPGVHCLPCQARGREGRSGGCQGQSVIPSGAKCQEPELPSVRSLENQQLACDLCLVVPGTTIRDTSLCASMWYCPGVYREEVKGKQVWNKEAAGEQYSTQQ